MQLQKFELQSERIKRQFHSRQRKLLLSPSKTNMARVVSALVQNREVSKSDKEFQVMFFRQVLTALVTAVQPCLVGIGWHRHKF